MLCVQIGAFLIDFFLLFNRFKTRNTFKRHVQKFHGVELSFNTTFSSDCEKMTDIEVLGMKRRGEKLFNAVSKKSKPNYEDDTNYDEDLVDVEELVDVDCEVLIDGESRPLETICEVDPMEVDPISGNEKVDNLVPDIDRIVLDESQDQIEEIIQEKSGSGASKSSPTCNGNVDNDVQVIGGDDKPTEFIGQVVKNKVHRTVWDHPIIKTVSNISDSPASNVPLVVKNSNGNKIYQVKESVSRIRRLVAKPICTNKKEADSPKDIFAASKIDSGPKKSMSRIRRLVAKPIAASNKEADAGKDVLGSEVGSALPLPDPSSRIKLVGRESQQSTGWEFNPIGREFRVSHSDHDNVRVNGDNEENVRCGKRKNIVNVQVLNNTDTDRLSQNVNTINYSLLKMDSNGKKIDNLLPGSGKQKELSNMNVVLSSNVKTPYVMKGNPSLRIYKGLSNGKVISNVSLALRNNEKTSSISLDNLALRDSCVKEKSPLKEKEVIDGSTQSGLSEVTIDDKLKNSDEPMDSNNKTSEVPKVDKNKDETIDLNIETSEVPKVDKNKYETIDLNKETSEVPKVDENSDETMDLNNETSEVPKVDENKDETMDSNNETSEVPKGDKKSDESMDIPDDEIKEDLEVDNRVLVSEVQFTDASEQNNLFDACKNTSDGGSIVLDVDCSDEEPDLEIDESAVSDTSFNLETSAVTDNSFSLDTTAGKANVSIESADQVME